MNNKSPRLALICVGDELLDGRIADRNANTLGAYGARVGWPLDEVRFVGDDPAKITESIRALARPCTLIVVSGGLGPTLDDMTRHSVADAANVTLVEDADARARLEQRFADWGVPMSPTNLRQVQFPAGATVHPSRFGTADAFTTEVNGANVLCLPGVPREFNGLIDELLPTFGQAAAPDARQTLSFMGIGESQLGERIEALTLPQGLTISYLAAWPIVLVGVRAPASASEDVSTARDIIGEALETYRTPGDAHDLPAASAAVLRDRNLTIATAESCTGGLIASQITDVPGASAHFTHGWVTYANAAKVTQLDVPAELIEQHGAVSAPVVRAMAMGARAHSGADVSVAVSGIAGPGGGSDEKPVGTLFLAVATATHGVILHARFRNRDRARFKRATAALAHIALIRVLQSRAPELASVPGVERCISFDEVSA